MSKIIIAILLCLTQFAFAQPQNPTQTFIRYQEQSLIHDVRDIQNFAAAVGIYPGPISPTYAIAHAHIMENPSAYIGVQDLTQIGEGNSAIVYRAGNTNRVFKIPKSPEKAAGMQVEYLVNRFLRQNYSRFGILVDTIPRIDPNGAFIEKQLLDRNQIAENIRPLSALQRQKLRTLWENSRRVSRETGIGLDIKASNLYWNGTDWMLFDCGPRMGYLPYGFTTDLHSFNQYLRIWREFDPPETEHNETIDDAIEDLSRNVQ